MNTILRSTGIGLALGLGIVFGVNQRAKAEIEDSMNRWCCPMETYVRDNTNGWFGYGMLIDYAIDWWNQSGVTHLQKEPIFPGCEAHMYEKSVDVFSLRRVPKESGMRAGIPGWAELYRIPETAACVNDSYFGPLIPCNSRVDIRVRRCTAATPANYAILYYNASPKPTKWYSDPTYKQHLVSHEFGHIYGMFHEDSLSSCIDSVMIGETCLSWLLYALEFPPPMAPMQSDFTWLQQRYNTH